MKKGLITLAILLGTSVLTNAKGQADPVLMTVGGKPVTLSEFEYLYHKNNAQQSTPQDIEEYLKLFVPYRQKVAAAEALGLDKTESFEKEFNTYRHDLAAPYMIDQAVEDSIYAAQYERMKEDVDVSHIMIFYQSPGRTAEQKKAVMDSLLNCVNAGENFADLATRFSEDKGSARNGGRMGFISANRFPATFENAAYTLADGEHSGVITTPYGYHIVKVNAHRPARGQVLVEHILRLTRGKSDEEAAAQRQYIDSLYTLVSNGADFETVARENSEDPGSATQGGKLPWFGTGKMVPEFEDVAFSLENNAISQPFATAYGYHIIKRLDGKDIESFDQAKGTIKNAISRDERGQLASRRRLDQLQTKFGVKKDEKAIANVKKQIAVAGVDSALLASFKTSNTTIAKFGKNKVTLADVITNELPNGFAGKAEDQATQFDNAIKRRLDAMTVEAEETALMNEEPSYRNLVNEYRDGMLMFEIQDRNVWTKAKADQEGLEKFFQDNKANYSNWESPKFKSRIIFAESDSLLQEIDAYVKANNIPADSLATALRAKYGKNVKVERVLAAKGENAITDYLGFGGEKPEAQGRWNSYEAYEPKMIDQPEEAIDVRGAVITDYQDYLLNQWLEELDKQYPAVVNQKVLSQAK